MITVDANSIVQHFSCSFLMNRAIGFVFVFNEPYLIYARALRRNLNNICFINHDGRRCVRLDRSLSRNMNSKRQSYNRKVGDIFDYRL
jgi:hypothetical protein